MFCVNAGERNVAATLRTRRILPAAPSRCRRSIASTKSSVCWHACRHGRRKPSAYECSAACPLPPLQKRLAFRCQPSSRAFATEWKGSAAFSPRRLDYDLPFRSPPDGGYLRPRGGIRGVWNCVTHLEVCGACATELRSGAQCAGTHRAGVSGSRASLNFKERTMNKLAQELNCRASGKTTSPGRRRFCASPFRRR